MKIYWKRGNLQPWGGKYTKLVLFTSINKTQGIRQKIKTTPETIHKRPFSKIVGCFISYTIDLAKGPGGMLRWDKELWILQDESDRFPWKASIQILESLLKQTWANPCSSATWAAHNKVSASTWRGIEVLVFQEVANTPVPLQSRTTMAKEEWESPKAASTLILTQPSAGTDHFWTKTEGKGKEDWTLLSWYSISLHLKDEIITSIFIRPPYEP